MANKTIGILVGLLLIMAGPLSAAETGEIKSALKNIGKLWERGTVNFATTLAEPVYVFPKEKKAHPKAWPVTYIPRFFTNMAIRVGSTVNDFVVLPWCPTRCDTTPLTRRFDLPDYVWQKE